jgi:hypothetical protein
MSTDDLPDLVGRLTELARSKTFLNRAIFIVLGVWLVFGVITWCAGPDFAGPFGDSFGALNSLVTGLTLLGAFYAVALQREEIDIARQQVRDSEAARQKSEGLLARQAEALLASAQLNAVNSLLVAELPPPGKPHETILVTAGGVSNEVRKSEVLKQYLRIVLHHVAGPRADPGQGAPSGASMFRRYVLDLVRDTRARIDATGSDLRLTVIQALTSDLSGELWLILGHVGVAGSPDATLAESGIAVLNDVAIAVMRREDPRDDLQIFHTADAALCALQRHAEGGV